MEKENNTSVIALTLINNNQLYLVVNGKNNFGFTKNILKATKFIEMEGRRILENLKSFENSNINFKLVSISNGK